MVKKKNNRGLGEYQKNKATKAKEAILKVLVDGEWHQYKEIKEKAELSNPTLSKHLKEFKKGIEKKEDEKDSRIVYYRLKDTYLTPAVALSETFADMKVQKEVLLMTKDPLLVMEQINNYTNFGLTALLKILKNEVKTAESDSAVNSTILFLLESWIWQPYKLRTAFLIDEAKKILNDIDIQQLENKIEDRRKELLEILHKEGMNHG
jgi:DNA-binding transcriptional ArsR family regulator